MAKFSKIKWCLLGCLIVVLLLVIGSVFLPYRLIGVMNWVADNDLAGRLRAIPGQEAQREDMLTEMVVDTVGVSKANLQPMVLLKGKDKGVYLPIWIGLLEANAISVVLEGIEVPRPLTVDLLSSIMNEMGAEVDFVVINDLQDSTYYAKIVLRTNWARIEIDARPSDAIAIALRMGAPIYVANSVLEKAGVSPEQKSDEFTTAHVGEERAVTL